MCGIVGFIDLKCETSRLDLSIQAERMALTLAHRGPDSGGVWVDPSCGIALAHRRLSIIDLSPLGNQPMKSADARYVITYNGELYNFQQLRRELEDTYPFRGESDTEVILASFERWGITKALEHFNGMFAIAVWDSKSRQLWLCRDRMGEKPLYYGWSGKHFFFASELKALSAHYAFRGDIDRNALKLYMRHNCVPAPSSIYSGILKLRPGHVLSVDFLTGAGRPEPYWELGRFVGGSSKTHMSTEDAVDETARLLTDAVKLRMLADVPVGAFLSGGIDSSLVVALMQSQSSSPIRTFTIGFRDQSYDEAQSAATVGRYLGTQHTELYVTPAEALEIIPTLPCVYDEPFADSSQIPTLLVAQLAKQHVTVGLSGDGGDELFGGYNRHVWTERIWNRFAWMPARVKQFVGGSIRLLSSETWDDFFNVSDILFHVASTHRNAGMKLYKLADLLRSQSLEATYTLNTSHWTDPSLVVLGGDSEMRCWADPSDKQISFTEQMMYMDAMSYLPDDILTKVDRASMAVSLEARVPFLDHRLVEFACLLPLELKIRNGRGKWLLRELLFRHVPREIVDRPKAGFGIPLDDWLRGPLRDWSESLISTERLEREGFFKAAPIRHMWAEHLAGRGCWQYHLWDVLMFQAWLDAHLHTAQNQREFVGHTNPTAN
jgi:asparagine synthase (glutamine-hydrolysing)